MEAEQLNALSNQLQDLRAAQRRTAEVSLTSMASRNAWPKSVNLAEDPAIWQDAKRAQELGRERKMLEGVVLGLSQTRARPQRCRRAV